jgi:hypothetical protein
MVVYILGRVHAGCRAAHLHTHSQLGTAWPAGTGWCGQSGQVGAASRSRSASADRPLLPRDFGDDVVGVTSVLPVVTSGRDVRV